MESTEILERFKIDEYKCNWNANIIKGNHPIICSVKVN